MSRPRFPWGLTVAVAISLGILIALGSWQLARKGEKEQEIAREQAVMNAPPAWLPNIVTGAVPLKTAHRTPVEADCPGLAQAPYVELYGVLEGKMIRRLISACPLAEGPYDAILVDRGYVADFISARPNVIEDDHPVRIAGVLFSPEAAEGGIISQALVAAPSRPEGAPPLYMERDLEGMAADLGVERPAPWFLIASTSSNPDWQALTPLPPSTSDQVSPGKHLEYAMTWFALATTLLCIYAAMLFRRFKTL